MPRKRSSVATPLDYLSKAADVHAAHDGELAAGHVTPAVDMRTPPVLSPSAGGAAYEEEEEENE